MKFGLMNLGKNLWTAIFLPLRLVNDKAEAEPKIAVDKFYLGLVVSLFVMF